tara:strand:+ start:158 stop:1105 length:948 start_codon:yes stop_codon:yes gene_type:complete
MLLSVAVALGHENIKSDYNHLRSINHDAYVYIDVAREGSSAISGDHRSTRLLMPLSAYYLSKINPFSGKYSTPQVNLFFISLIFFFASCLILFKLAKEKYNKDIAIYSVFFFSINFGTSNGYFYGTPDVAEFLFSLLLFFVLLKNKFQLLIPLFLIAAFNRESFIIFSLPVIFTWSFLLSDSEQRLKCLFYGIVGAILFLATFYFIKNIFQGDISVFSDRTSNLLSIKKFLMFIDIDNIRNLLYYIILLIPLGLIGLSEDKKLFYSAISIILIYLMISGFFVGSGAAAGRYIFSSAGPILVIGQAIFFERFRKLL